MLTDCDAMIDAARRAGVHLIVGHTHSFNAPILKMREIIRSGELGRVAMINTWNYGSFLYRPRRPEELRTDLGGGIIFNQVPHQVDIVRLLGGGKVRSVRSMVWALDPSRPTEGSHVTFLQFESGAAASLVFSGYDRFDSDEFHFWIGEMGQERPGGAHGAAWSALQKIGGGDAEANLKSSLAYGGGASRSAGSEGRWHQPHFGVTIVSCERGDMRQSQDGVTLYRAGGREEVPVPTPRAYPDKGGVFDELYRAVVSGEAPLHDGAWGKATLEICLAILQSAHERREIALAHQVSID
jgi:phthalate 4,5-cis-dihydrodiol dehydrogenase